MKYTACTILAICAHIANAANIRAKVDAMADPIFEWVEGKFPVETDKLPDYKVTHPILPDSLIEKYAKA